ncbi:MAG TPA: DUF4097 family beta strand repeat-containing protein [Oleiagrimonas sp.]|nr:DUF4097 family beta strand repeat-containing protein [Oleiagrimonas sp.]
MNNLIKPLLFVAFALVAVPAMADTPIHQSHALDPDAELTVRNVSGAIIVHTWDRHEVRITGTLGNNVRKLEIDGDAHELEIAVKGPNDDDSGWLDWGSDSSMGPTTLELTVPKSVNLELHTVSARIEADGLDGGEIDAKSVSGNITIKAHSPDIDIDSVSGDVRFSGQAGEIEITTVSGDIRAGQAGHEANTQSVSGDIHLSGGPLHEVSMESVSGDLFFDGALTADAKADLHSMSGDIHLTLPEPPQATLKATTFSGDIRSPWGKVNEPEYGPGSKLDTRIGSGDARITLKTFSGDVDIRKGTSE